jgi:hypothetical protein
MPRDVSVVPLTDWNLIRSAGSMSSTPQKVALQALVVQYLPALQAHVASKWRIAGGQTEDWVQAFLSAKVVEGNLLSSARPERGRFRNFLRKTLDDFIISQIRHQNAKKRSPGRIGDLESAAPAVDRGPDPNMAFEIAWAKQVIADAVERMKRECQASQREDLWGVFESRVLQPALDASAPPMPYETLVRKFGFNSPLQAANALTTAKRMFERNLRAVLREYVQDEKELEDEIIELRAILSRGGA